MAVRAGTSRHLPAVAAAAAIAVAACNPPAPTSSTVPTTSPTSTPASTPGASAPPAADIYAAIRRDVESIRGLQPTAAVDTVTIDEAQLRQNLEAEFDRENSANDLAFTEQTLILLGLLPGGSSLRGLTLDFQGSSVAGYYSPDKKQLFVVSRSGQLGPAEEVTYAHEFTHQLQDQHFELSKLGEDAASQGDRALAQLSLIEGDAVSVQTTWTIQNLTPEEMGELLQASLDPTALEALRRAPPYLRETALFPYQGGLTFVTGLMSSGDYQGVNTAFDSPPDSTEQVLHPEKYAGRETPVKVELPKDLASSMGSGWTAAGQDTLGEFVLRLWLTENGVPAATATTAAAGWGGDRVVLLRGPSGAMTVGLVSRWDTPADATEFADAATTAIERLGTIQRRGLVSGSKAVVVTIGDQAKKLLSLIGDVAATGQ
jgi:hypothetical protein